MTMMIGAAALALLLQVSTRPPQAEGGGGGAPTYPLTAPAANNCAAIPYSFSGDSNTGMCSPSADALHFYTGGSNKFQVGSGSATFEVQSRHSDGTLAFPGIAFSSSVSTGLYRELGNLNFAVGGVLQFTLAPSSTTTPVPLTATNATVTTGSCALCVGGDPAAMGWGRRTSPSANRVMAMVVNGSDFAYFDAFNAGSWEANWTNVNFFTFRNGGTVSAPGVRWGSTGQGFSSSNDELIYVSPGGVKEVGFSDSGLNFEFVTVTVADNAVGASPAAATLTVSNNLVKLVCNDADGCNITVSENIAGSGTFGLAPGRLVYIVNTSANVCNFSDTAGVTELAGAFAMGQYDSLTLVHFGAGSPQTWVEVARSDN